MMGYRSKALVVSLAQAIISASLFFPLFFSVGSALGVNWGMVTSHPLPAPVVVRMLQANGIHRVKLFDANPDALKALAGSGIEVMVGIPNGFLQSLSSSLEAADQWVQDNVTRYMGKGGTNIKYVAVGNEPFLTSYGGRYTKTTYPALYNIYQSLVRAGLGDQVKVTVPCNADILQNTVPSKGAFRANIKNTMAQVASLLSKTGAPILVNIYPFLDLILDKDFPQDYAFFEGSLHTVTDGQAVYTNALDASIDMLISALRGIGFPDIPVVVGEIGWPSDGGVYANVSLAQKFNQGLLNHVLSKRGTPLRPGSDIEVFLFGLFDENQKSTLPGNFERHWGIFSFDGQAKYPLDLTGQGLNSIALVNAENVPYLPSRWCILNPDGNASYLSRILDTVCSAADCTALQYGGSCNGIGEQGNASYALNNYYQLNKQDPNSCSFSGAGLITFIDPSIENCRFLVGVSGSTSYAIITITRLVIIIAVAGLWFM